MLTNLHISNIVLIEKLNLEFGRGLNILTGETGAGKSILLDALSLALGARSDVGLVRHGCDSAMVVAEFDGASDELKQILVDNGIDYDGSVILRRTLTTDGKSRAWINDTPVSIKTLKQVGDILVEMHGQFANHALLNQSTHRATLDAFAISNINGFADVLNDTRNAYLQYHTAQKRMTELQDMLSRSALERDFLAHNVNELRTLNPQPGEEESLADARAAMMNAEKDAAIIAEAVDAISNRGQTLDATIYSVAHILERIKTAPNPYQEQIDKLYDIAESISEIAAALTPGDIDVDNLDAIEERLFAIRAAARKHRVSADELPELLNKMSAQLDAIDNSDAELKKVSEQVSQTRKTFDTSATQLTKMRRDAAALLRTRILAELPELKLGGMDFMVEIADCAPSAAGHDDIT